MNEQVRLEVAVPGGAEWTVGAGEGLLSCVCPDVCPQEGGARETVGTAKAPIALAPDG